ncbi:klcB [Aminobacter sp. SR38]|uniref:klcB n=1 Tax=Aminobacter sp. SR38 TaxID=2774562 RepID=UPI001FEDF707|nr:klcB [Aminobacter sp. SR38]
MAKKRKTPAQPGQDWNAPAAELLAELPTDRDELLAAAVAAVVEIDAAIMRGDGAAAEAASDRYEAVIWKMNGGTHVGSMADHDAPGQVIERHCAAVPGDVPLWGQRGQFLVADGDMRALVEYEAGYGGPLGAHFQFHVIDLDRPFISETGYRSHFDTAQGCMTVDEVARGILAAQRAEKKRPVMVEASYRDRLADAPCPLGWPAWSRRRGAPATVLVPPGFVLVDVVLPSHRAFIARRWAAEAATRIKAARAAGLDAKGKSPAQARARSRIARNDDDLQHRQSRRCRAGRGRACIAGNNDAASERGNLQHRQEWRWRPGRPGGVQARPAVRDRERPSPGFRPLHRQAHHHREGASRHPPGVGARRQAGNVQDQSRRPARGRFRPELHPVDLRLRPVAAYHLTRRTNE